MDVIFLLELLRSRQIFGSLLVLKGDWWGRSSQIPNRSHKHPNNSKKWALIRLLQGIKSISLGPKEKKNETSDHWNTRNSKSHSPTKIFLRIWYSRNGCHDSEARTKIPPVEEGALEFGLLGILGIKLIGSKSLDAGPVPTLCYPN